MKFYVYVLTRKSDGKVIYVGKGSGRRMFMHRQFATGWKTVKQKKLYALLAALIASGDDFFPRKVFESDDEGEVIQKEIETIQHYGMDNLYNGALTVFGIVNSKRAQRAREAIRQSRLGMKFSDEHRANIRKAVLARPPRSSEQRRNQSVGQTGITHKKHSNALPADLKRAHRLLTYARQYQRRRESELARLKTERGAQKLKSWQAQLQAKGLPLDTPMPAVIGPLAAYTPEQRVQRKRARERLNHALRKAKTLGDTAEIARLETERRKLDETARKLVRYLLDESP